MSTNNMQIKDFPKATNINQTDLFLMQDANGNTKSVEASRIMVPGPQGPQGPPGATPNFTIGTVTTLPAGSNATVTLTGTFPNLVLNFGIPRGADGGGGEPTPEAKKYLGLITTKAAADIVLSDLLGLESSSVVKPQTTYAHSSGTTGNKVLVCAIPKSFGTITSVVDGAGVNITNAYTIVSKTFNSMAYSMAVTTDASLWNNTTVIKFNIQ